jgi:cell division protein FtsI (penicillin-binding protein 3)
MMKPYMVKEIRQDGQTLEIIKPQVLNDEICSDRTLGQLQDMLHGVVTRGTAKQAFEGCMYSVAGKTGTARISNEGQRGYTNKHMSSFVGYFPVENPQYSIIVVINEPKGAIYGGIVAAPVFREIANKIYSSHIQLQPEAIKPFETQSVPKVANGNLQITKDILNELGISSQTTGNQASSFVRASSKTKSIVFTGLPIVAGVVPNFIGMGIRDAQSIASKLNIRISFSGYGRVTEQSISPGTRFKQSINLNLELKP